MHNTIKRVGLGLAILVIGIIIGYLSENLDLLIPNECQDATPLWCAPIKLAFSDFGLKGISYTFIVIGSILIVLYDFVASIFGRVLTFAMEHVSNAKLIIFQAIDKGHLKQNDLNELFLKSFESFKGGRDNISRSLGEFILNKILEQHRKDGGFWRRDYSVDVTVSRLDDSAILDRNNYLHWREVSNFKINHSSGGGKYAHTSSIYLPLPADSLESAIKNMKYELSVDTETVFSISDVFDEIDFTKLISGDQQNVKELFLEYQNGFLKLSLEMGIDVLKSEADFVLIEESFISINDNTFVMHFFEPTQGAKVRFTLPGEFEIYEAGLAGDRFGTQKVDGVTCDVRGSWARMDSRHWYLPGIVAILAWKPRT